MKNKSKIFIAKEGTPEYQKAINKLSWEEIIARRGNPMTRDEVLKRVASFKKK